jgi:hypothetical protein
MAVGRKVNATGRSTGEFASAKFRAANQPPKGEPWVWFTRAMIQSAAYRAMSGGAHQILGRIMDEHMAHGGGKNGELPVTYDDFTRYGIRRNSVLSFLTEAMALGFVARTREGVKAYGPFQGSPALYRLTWLPTCDGAAATNEWKRIQTLMDARTVVKRSRLALKAACSKSRPSKGYAVNETHFCQ